MCLQHINSDLESLCSIINWAGRLPINKIKLSPVRGPGRSERRGKQSWRLLGEGDASREVLKIRRVHICFPCA
ncbi:putative Atp-Dependent Rna Helicase Ddx27 [Manis pentadactyla]|nr:putative Atp-Dependent Rna Helicase Ddx27 [Manis pentadactyla]